MEGSGGALRAVVAVVAAAAGAAGLYLYSRQGASPLAAADTYVPPASPGAPPGSGGFSLRKNPQPPANPPKKLLTLHLGAPV